MSRTILPASNPVAGVTAGADQVSLRREAGLLPLVGTGRVGKLGRVNDRAAVAARGTLSEAAILDHVEVVASYLNIVITTTLTAPAAHQYRTEQDPVGDPGFYRESDEAGLVTSSELTIVGVPAATDLVLYVRMWVPGVFDSGWFDSTIRFSTPRRNDPDITTIYQRTS